MNQEQKHIQPRRGLVAARNARQWSQLEVADQLGTTPLSISRWERGLILPSQYYRERLVQLFNTSLVALDLVEARTGDSPHATLRQTDPLVPRVVLDRSIIDPTIPLLQSWRLLGRDGTLAELKMQLRAGDSYAVCALNGLPGIGKTALAVTLAHDPEVREMFPDGVLWAALGPDPNLIRVFSRWGTLLGVTEAQMSRLSTLDAWALELRMAIGGRTMLLIVDDAWMETDALALKVGGPKCSYLLTTRSPVVATSFASTQVTQVGELGEQESLTLLATLAGETVYQEHEAARLLVQAVGGLPLALVLIGRSLRVASAGGQPRRLHAALARLQQIVERLRLSEPQAPTERHPSLASDAPLSLQAVIAASVGRLAEAVQEALYALSVFPAKPHSFSEKAALFVATCATETLDTLFDAGLIESMGPGRYSLHQTIADYGLYQYQQVGGAAPTPSVEMVGKRLVTYYTGFVEQHRGSHDALGQEIANITKTLDASLTYGMDEQFIELTLGMANFWEVRSMYKLAETYLLRAQQVVRTGAAGTVLTLLSLLLHRGNVARIQGYFEQATALYGEGITLARKSSNTETLCVLLAKNGWATEKRGLYTEAEEYLQEALALARRYAYSHLLPDILNTLGTVADETGDPERATALYQEGLALARERGDQQQICVLLINLGAAVTERGNMEQGEIYELEALALARQMKHHAWTCLLLHNLGTNVLYQGKDDQASAYYTEGLALARITSQREWIPHLLGGLGGVATRRHEYTQAEQYLSESLEMARALEKPWLIADILQSQGEFLLQQQRIDQAEGAFLEIKALLSEENSTLMLARALFGLAQVAATRGDVMEARELAEQSLENFRVDKDTRGQVEVREWLSTLPVGRT